MLKPVISMHFINCRVLSTSTTDLGFVFHHLVYGYRRAAVLQPHIGPTLSAITLILYVCAKMYGCKNNIYICITRREGQATVPL